MDLPKEVVSNFQEAYKKACNEELSFDEAACMAWELLSFFHWLYRRPASKLSTGDNLTEITHQRFDGEQDQ